MSVRNNHIRQAQAYVRKIVSGETHHFYPYDWRSSKQKVRYVADRVVAGKLAVPANCRIYYGITVVYVKADGSLSPFEG